MKTMLTMQTSLKRWRIPLLLLFSILCFMPAGWANAQEESFVRLDFKNVPVTKVLAEIERQTDYSFTYNKKQIAGIRVEKVVFRSEPLKNVLNYLEKTASLDFVMVNKLIGVKVKALNAPNSTNVPLPKANTIQAPDVEVSGSVADDKTGEPLVGVSISVKQSGNGTYSDTEGKFKILVPGVENTILVFSYVGYETVEFNFNSTQSLDVKMKESALRLNEAVVIGYGEQSRSRVTGAVSKIDGTELNKYAGTSFEQQMAGRIAGVQINQASGQPGKDAQVIVRGIGTLTAGNKPLIVVDGFPLSEGTPFSSINPQDIASIDILKDAASATIYGSRAANGVIIITTRKGKMGAPKFELDVFSGFQERGDNVKFVDAYDAATFFTEARDWGYVSKNPTKRQESDNAATRLANGASKRELRLNYLQPYLDRQPGLTNTDWLDEVFRIAPMSSYNMAVSGGTEKTTYYISANYFNQDGIVVGSDLERYSGSINIRSNFSKRMEFGLNINPSYVSQNFIKDDGNWSTDPVSTATIMYPFFAPYKADGTLAISEQIQANLAEDGALSENPLALMARLKNKRYSFRTFGNSFLRLELLPKLTYKVLLGGDYRSTFEDEYVPGDVGEYRIPAPKPARSTEYNGIRNNYLVEHTLTYTKNFGKHNLDLLAGYTFQKELGNQTSITGQGIPDDNVTNIAGASSYSVSPSRYVWTQVSYLGRAQYAYDGKYLLSVALRRDGSSRFGEESKWGLFPSVSAGWLLTKEGFMADSKLITYAKLRGSWGKTGNNQIGSFSSQALVRGSDYVYGTQLGAGFAISTSPNPNLSWETNTSYNFGLDLALWDKLTISANYYRSITSDLLLNVPVPEQSGFSSSLQNIGEIQNTGIELEISGKGIRIGQITVEPFGNITTNKNEVLALAPGQTQIITGQGSAFRTRVGGPIAELYGYKVVGVFKTAEEIKSRPVLPGTLTGDYIIEDVNGDGALTTADRTGFGTYNPKFTFGFGTNLTYKNFELSLVFNGVQGRTVHTFDQAYITEVGEGFGVPTQNYFDNRYHPVNNPDGFYAQPNLGNFSAARRDTRAASIYFVNADFVRLRTAQLSYTLPKATLSKLHLSNLRLYVTGNNLFTLTDFTNFNPEATTSDSVLTSGYSRGDYPIAKSLIFGIRANF